MNVGPIWNNTALAEKNSRNYRIYQTNPHPANKNSSFEAHFDRHRNTELANLVAKPNSSNLLCNKIKLFY